MEQESTILLMRIMARRAGAGFRLGTGLYPGYVFRIVAIEAQFPAVFHEQEFFPGLVRLMTERALPVFDRRMRVFGLHEKIFVATGANRRDLAFQALRVIGRMALHASAVGVGLMNKHRWLG